MSQNTGIKSLQPKQVAGKFSRFFAFVLIFLILSVTTPNFLKVQNLLNILNQASLNVIISIGMTLCMLICGIDLSVGAVLALTSCVSASFFAVGASVGNMLLGVVVSLGLGFLLGSLNGMAVSYLRLPPFLTTFGMQQVARGLAYLYMSGTIINKFDEQFLFFGKGDILGIPMPAIIAVVLILVIGFILTKTTIGRMVYSVGVNRSSAEYSGISIHKVTIFAFGMSGMIAALAGLVYTARLSAAEAVIGESFAQQAIAAAAIGGISFKGGSGSVYGTFIGALTLTIVINAMNLYRIPVPWQNFVTGTIIILAVLMDRKSTKLDS